MKYTVGFFNVQKEKINEILQILKYFLLCASIIGVLVVLLFQIIKSEMGAKRYCCFS